MLNAQCSMVIGSRNRDYENPRDGTVAINEAFVSAEIKLLIHLHQVNKKHAARWNDLFHYKLGKKMLRSSFLLNTLL